MPLSEENDRLVARVFSGWVINMGSWVTGADSLETLLNAARAEERAKAKALVERLRAGLEPFGDLPGEGSEDYPDDTPVTVKFGRTTDYSLKLGDLRQAAALLHYARSSVGIFYRGKAG